jgi:predicted DNA-binding protein
VSNKKGKKIRPKKLWSFRLNESMLAEVARLAAAKEMRPSEYVRRIIEEHLTQAGR